MIELAQNIVKICQEKKITFATCESITGGLISKYITDIPGASEVFFGGVVSYTNDVKQNVVGVSEKTLQTYTAISSQTAEEMARGVCNLMKTDYGISVTGLAGPGGGTAQTPVGTVYFAIADKNGAESVSLCVEKTFSREEIRELTALDVLSYFLQKISEKS